MIKKKNKTNEINDMHDAVSMSSPYAYQATYGGAPITQKQTRHWDLRERAPPIFLEFFFFLKFLFSFLFFHLVTQLLRLLPIFPPTAKPSLYIQQLCVCMCVCVPCMFGSAVKRKRKRQCNKGGAKIRKKKRKRRRNMRETRKCPAVKRLYN